MTRNLKMNRKRNNVEQKNAVKSRKIRIQKGVYNKCATKQTPMVTEKILRKQEKKQRKLEEREVKK